LMPTTQGQKKSLTRISSQGVGLRLLGSITLSSIMIEKWHSISTPTTPTRVSSRVKPLTSSGGMTNISGT
jgi:hypothetical protein